MHTLHHNHLTLRLVRLHPSEQWQDAGEGLSFILLKGGNGEYALRENRWSVLPGDVMVSNPAAGGKLMVRGGEVVFWCFSVCVEHLLPLFSAEEICLLQNVAESFKVSKLYAAASAVAHECHTLLESAPPQGNIDHRSQVLRIAATVLSVEFLNMRQQRNGFVRAEDHMIQVFDSLSAEELLTFSVDDLASRFGCSRRHLNRLFHQHFGLSVAALRMEMRLLKAVSLLRDPDAKIINVAEQCGFNHLGLFNSCFKRRFGDSPGQWRKIASQNSLLAPPAPNHASPHRGSQNSVRSPQNQMAPAIRAKVNEILNEAAGDGAGQMSGNLAGRRGPLTPAPNLRPVGPELRYRPSA
jgi:AraC-like DNA-binding protein